MIKKKRIINNKNNINYIINNNNNNSKTNKKIIRIIIAVRLCLQVAIICTNATENYQTNCCQVKLQIYVNHICNFQKF